MDRPRSLLAYFGHHKAASDWIHNIARDACQEMGLNYVYIHNARQFDHDLGSFVRREKIDFLTYANADLSEVKDCLNCIRGFHVVRDPRDITVSAYFSHLYSHSADDFPRLVGHREKLRQSTKEQGLLLELEFEKPNFDKMNSWDYALPNVLELKMEQIIREPGEHFRRIFAFLGVLDGDGGGLPRKFTAKDLAAILDRYDFAKQSGGRKPGQEDPKSHYRKGVPGDWKNHFTEEHKTSFKQNFNDLLVKLGYEQSDNW
jgi:hypothetical protein